MTATTVGVGVGVGVGAAFEEAGAEVRGGGFDAQFVLGSEYAAESPEMLATSLLYEAEDKAGGMHLLVEVVTLDDGVGEEDIEVTDRLEQLRALCAVCGTATSAPGQGVARFFSAWFEAPELFIVVERPRASLSQLLNRPTAAGDSNRPVLSADQAMLVAVSTLRGLQTVHGAGFAHLDVRPETIVVRGAREVVLGGGFQLARRAGHADSTSSFFVGSAAYSAPEIIDGDGARWGQSSDVWSLGLVIFVMATGRLPRAGDTSAPATAADAGASAGAGTGDANGGVGSAVAPAAAAPAPAAATVPQTRSYFATLVGNAPRLSRTAAPHFSLSLCAVCNRALTRNAQTRPTANELLDTPSLVIPDSTSLAELLGPK